MSVAAPPSFDVELTEEDFRVAGAAMPGERSPISPLPPTATPGTPSGRLRDNGVVDASGQLGAAAASAFEVLRTARAYVSVVCTSMAGGLDAALYNAGDRPVALVGGPTGIRLRDPADPAGLYSSIADLIGYSSATVGQMENTLSGSEAQVLLALLEAWARANGSALSSIDVGRAVEAGARSEHSLSGALRSTLRLPAAGGDVDASLTSLAAKDLLVKDARGILPSEATSTLAAAFPEVGAVVSVRAGHATRGGGLIAAHLHAARGLGPATLAWQPDPAGGVYVHSTSPDQLLAEIAALVLDPDPLATLESAPPPVAPSPTRFCSGCGAARSPDGHFCASCGTPYADSPRSSRSGG